MSVEMNCLSELLDLSYTMEWKNNDLALIRMFLYR